MSQMKLITDSRDEWTVKELLETMHEKQNELERKLDAQLTINASIQWQLHAIILHLTGDRAALTAFVMASEPTVVPNEDEAMPVVDTSPEMMVDPSWVVLASCPACDTKAYTEAGIYDFFGYRTPAGGETIKQSWCRECRKSGKDKTLKRNRKAPTPWSKNDSQAAAFTAAATAADNAKEPLQRRLANDTLTPSERADLMRRVEVLESKHAAAKSDYNKRIKQLGYVHPPNKPKGDK